MMRKSFAKRLALGITTAAFACGTLTAHAPAARAEGVAPTFKGAIGGGLLGAEIIAMPMGIAGVRAPWAYAVFPALGAVGGVIGGYFVDQLYVPGSADQAYGSAFLLAGGMVLLIPTVVVMLNATRWRPAEEATEDRPAKDYPPADPGKAGGSVITGGTSGGATPTPAPAPKPADPKPAGSPGGGAPSVPLSLFHIQGGSFSLGVPVPELRTDYTLREVKDYGVKQTTMVHLPVLKVAF